MFAFYKESLYRRPYTEDFVDSLGSISRDEGDLIPLPTDKSEWEKADILQIFSGTF